MGEKEQQNWTNKAQSKKAKQLAIRQKHSNSRSTKAQRHCHFITPVQPYGRCNRDTACDIRFIRTIYQLLIKSLFTKTPRQHHLIVWYFYIAGQNESRLISNPQNEPMHKSKCFVTIELRQIIYNTWVSKHTGISYMLYSLIRQHAFGNQRIGWLASHVWISSPHLTFIHIKLIIL